MRRLAAAVAAITLMATGMAGAVTAHAPAAAPLLAGVGVVDATWHVGAGAGQYASDQSPSLQAEWDPNMQHVKQASSYGVQSRLSFRAIVLQSAGEQPVAIVKDDNYLAQDMLTRRAAQILAADGSKVTYDNILLSATHDHNSPYYSTPAWGVWLFQDVFDIRMFEYSARVMAHAIEAAEKDMRPARVGATTVQFPDFQGNIAGSGVNEDGSPVGYPQMENDHGLVVMRFDDISDLSNPKPLATWINYAEHGESLDGYDLISADWLGPFQRYVDRATGVPTVFAQGSVGSAEGPYEHAYPPGQAPTTTDGGDTVSKIWAHMGYAQAERGTHLMAEKVVAAWNAIGQSTAGVQVPYQQNPVVKMITHWVAGPLSHPYPSVGNCRTGPSLDGDPGVPAAGLPDCQRLDDVTTLPNTGLYESLKAAGIPVPENYDVTSHGAVEENLRIKLQAVRIGDILLASCSCEAQSDLIKALETRTDKDQNNKWNGMDYADPSEVAAAWPDVSPAPLPCHLAAGKYDCPDPRYTDGQHRLQVSPSAFAHMEAEINNPSDGWDATSYVPYANAEPTDPKAIKGNFTSRELSQSCGYALSVGLGHTGDYDGYTVSYREYMARDAYRKALTSYGAHTADYMVSRLISMASNLMCGTPIPAEPTDPIAAADEVRQQAEATVLGQIASAAYDVWSAQIPDSAGPAAATTQPKNITRFDAATFSWTGGDNWTDNPTVVVQRMVDGQWTFYADQSGEVQTMLNQPGNIVSSLPSYRTGKQRWTWTANFEAFDAYPRADIPGGQVPDGTYRFVVAGHIHQNGAVQQYELPSDQFTVARWEGIHGGNMTVNADTVSFDIDPIVYPRTYKSPFKFVHDDLGGTPGHSIICKTCAFQPWATRGEVVNADVSVLDANGAVVQTVPATFDGTHWVAQVTLAPGQTVEVAPGGIRDAYGETNGTAITPA